MPGVLGVVFNLLVCFGIPLGALIYYLVKKRKYLLSFGLGAATFVVFQVLTRIPFLSLIQNQSWYMHFALEHPVIVILLLSFTAGLFEETGRFLIMSFFMKKHHAYGDGIAFGFGHGGIEAALLVGAEWIYLLVTQWVLVWYSSGLSLMASGIERVFTFIVHIGLSLIVLLAVSRKKIWLWLVAILLHTWVNLASVLTLRLSGSVWLSEAMLAVCAIGFLAFILLARKMWPKAAPQATIQSDADSIPTHSQEETP